MAYRAMCSGILRRRLASQWVSLLGRLGDGGGEEFGHGDLFELEKGRAGYV